jgi:hypothetical protein
MGRDVGGDLGDFVVGLFAEVVVGSGTGTGGGGGGGGGGCVAGRHPFVVWQSTHFVGNVSWPGNGLASYSGRWQVTQSVGVPFSTASAAGVPLWQYEHGAFACAPVSGDHS